MQQSGRQSVHKKLFGMTSKTYNFFETDEILWSSWLKNEKTEPELVLL